MKLTFLQKMVCKQVVFHFFFQNEILYLYIHFIKYLFANLIAATTTKAAESCDITEKVQMKENNEAEVQKAANQRKNRFAIKQNLKKKLTEIFLIFF